MARGVLLALVIGLALAAGMWLVLRPSITDMDAPSPPGGESGHDWGAGEGDPTDPGEIDAPPPEPPKPVRERVADAIRAVLSADPNAANPLMDDRWRALLAEEGATEALIDRARRAEDLEEQAAALLLLGLSPDPVAGELVAAAANGELGEPLRLAAVLALANADSQISTPVLRDIALRDRDIGRATTAIQVLLGRDPHGTFDLIGQVMERSDATVESRQALYRLMAGESPDPSGDGVEVATRYRDQLAPPAGPFLEASDVDPAATGKLLAAIEREYSEDGDPELRLSATDALARLKGEAAARTFGKIFGSLPAEEQIHLVSRINPVENPGMLAEAFRLAPEAEIGVRQILTGYFQVPAEPEYLAHLRDWRREEKDSVLRGSLDVAIRRMQEALR